MGLLAVVARHFSHRERGYQEHLLLGAAGYLREYSGGNPDEALRNVVGILEVVGRAENLNAALRTVQDECLRVKANVGESLLHQFYHPALASLAEKIEALA